MSRLASTFDLSTSLFARPRRSSLRTRAELKPIVTSRFTRLDSSLLTHWGPERLARLHEPLTRYHD
jgi:hypothetical protein